MREHEMLRRSPAKNKELADGNLQKGDREKQDYNPRSVAQETR